MIGYVTLGTNRFDEAATFYDELFGSIGAGRAMEGDRFIAWSTGPRSPAVSITKPFNQEPATAGNGTMVFDIAANDTLNLGQFSREHDCQSVLAHGAA